MNRYEAIFNKYGSGRPIIIRNLFTMPLDEFALFVLLISDDQMVNLILKMGWSLNEKFFRLFCFRTQQLTKWDNDLADGALQRLQYFIDLYNESLDMAAQEENKMEKSNVVDFNASPRIDIIGELKGALQLENEPVEGKYRPSNKSYRSFVHWLFENKYDDYLTERNFFKYICCEHSEETIKRYYRDEREIARYKNGKKRQNG
jgi:hypothetical protein